MCGLKSQLLLGDEDNVRSQAFLDRSLLFLAYLPQYQILVVFFLKKGKIFSNELGKLEFEADSCRQGSEKDI